jgi:hypothetical protein
MIDLPLKDLVKDSFLYPWVQGGLERVRNGREMRAWLRAGGSGPPPHLLKQGILRSFAREHNLRTLVETGTYLGGMVHALRDDFDRVVSIEVDDALCARARHRFARDPKVTIAHGDSMVVLPEVLASIQSPTLFWLDGHFSGGATSKGALDTPVEREVELVLAHPVKGHVVLIDDARCFVGANDYPTLDALRARVAELAPGLRFEVAHDIIRIYAPLAP